MPRPIRAIRCRGSRTGRRAPAVPNPQRVQVEREDPLMEAYWQQLGQLRARGWQIDAARLAGLEREHAYVAIPSPARRHDPEGWVYAAVPRVTAG